MASMRKRKARLDQQNLARLKSKNAEKTQELSEKEMQSIGDELVRSTVDSFERELEKASPAIRKLAEQFSLMIQEFFVGYKEGVDTEIKEYIKNANQSLEKSVEVISKPIEEPRRKLVDPSEVSKAVLGRGKEFYAPKQSFGARAAQFGVAVLGGALGFDKASQAKVEEMKRREAFIQTEMKLRPDASRRQLKEDYKQIETKTKELSKLEGESQLLKEQGYSEEQIDKLLNFQEKQMSILNDLIKADPSRLGKYKELTEKPVASGKLEEEQQEAALVQKRSLSEQEQQTALLMEIKELLKAGGGPGGEAQAEGGEFDIPSPGGILRRIPGVLRRIPGMLRRGAQGLGRVARTVARGGMAAGRAALGAARSIASGTMRIATTPLSGVAKFAAPLAAGLSVGEGISDLAEGKRVETLGDIVPEGWSAINPFSWAMRGGMYAGEKLNQGYGAISESLGGTGSLGGDIYEGVQKGKELVTTGYNKAVDLTSRGIETTVNAVSSGVERAQQIAKVGLETAREATSRGIETTVNTVSSGVERAQQIAKTGIATAREATSRGIEAAAPVVTAGVERAKEITSLGISKARAGVSAGIEATANAASRARESISSGLSSVSNWFGSKPVEITPQNVTPRQVSPVLRQQPVNQATVDAATAAAKGITVNVPPPSVVTVPPPKQNVIMPSFVHSVRNREPSVSDYLRTRYAG